MNIPTTVTPTQRRIRRVLLACVQCRSRKVRCDATQPACIRCRRDEKQCEYQKSRRGGRPRRDPHTTLSPIPHNSSPEPRQIQTESNDSSCQSSERSTESNRDSPESRAGEKSLQQGTHLTKVQVDQLLAQYYTHFHASHPCVLPRWSLDARMTTETGILEFLLPVLLYIGSIFTQSVDSGPLATAAASTMRNGWLSGELLPDPYFIQALMLYSIAVYWCDEPERGRELLDEAINGAFILGMHQKNFAEENGRGDLVLEESWRRTWWQIHVTDIHIAGSLHSYQGLSVKHHITANLPCEEQCYESGMIPAPPTLKNYNTREFSDVQFSSFAQLIGLTQGISRILDMRQSKGPGYAKETCANAETMMTAWYSLLPTSKRRILREDGSVDELLFKANALMHTYIVDLHRQLSNLQYSTIESVAKCAPPPPPSCNDSIKDDAPIHTAKVLSAIGNLDSLLTLPTRFTTHTPFIICMISNVTIAHLSACRYIFREPTLSLEREKIRLKMGVLKMLGEVWPAGKREYQTMGIVAREILALKEEEIQIPTEVASIALDVLDFNFDFDMTPACDLFSSAPELSLVGLSDGLMA